jgi:hypothetical protein
MQCLNPLSLNCLMVNIIDVSKGGLKLALDETINVGAHIRVRLEDTFILGDVRYCNRSGEKFYVGVRIQDVFNSRVR